VTDDPRVATYSHTDATSPPREREMMTTATASSHRTRQLMNHHRANSAVTTGTVAPRHAMPRCGNKTMTTTIPGHVLTLGQDGLPYKPSLLVSPSLRLMTTRSREPLSLSLYVTWPPDSIYGRPGPPSKGDRLSRLHSVFIHLTPPTSFPYLTHPIVRTSEHSIE
jgi:hypothetical protein